MLLLDTDIVFDILRQFPPALQWLSSQSINEEIVLPGFVVMELIQGCYNKSDVSKVQAFITPFPLLWPSSDVADQALAVYAEGRLSHNLGLLDALIGQIAISLDEPLYIFNQKHFAAIPYLQTIQPYQR